MNTKTQFTAIVCVCAMMTYLLVVSPHAPVDAAGKASGALAYMKNVQTGDPGLRSIGRISFGPDGLLLVAEPAASAVVAIDTGDTGPVRKLKKRIDNVDKLAAATLGAEPGSVQIIDMAVNQQSGRIYLSVQRKADKLYTILTVDSEGEFGLLDLKKAKYVRVNLPAGEKSKVSAISGVQFAKDRVLAAGQCNEEFASKIYSLPIPLTHDSSASIYSTETYHVAHGRWETRAPIRSFVPHEEDGKNYIVGSFACTPIAKFPLDDVNSGSKITGTSVVELGSGNMPLDMFTYKKDGKNWLVVNTDRFHWKSRGGFGPSKLWGVRVDMDYLSAEKTNKEATRRDTRKKTGPDGIEILDILFYAREVDKLNDNEVVILRDKDGKLDLEVEELP